MSAKAGLNGHGMLGFPPGAFGEHDGHEVHPHDHRLHADRIPYCTERWFCATCRPGKSRGTWFWGPECSRPKTKTAAKEKTG